MFKLDTEKEAFTMRMMKNCNRFPREVVEVPCLKMIKVRLDRALTNLVYLKMSLLIWDGLDRLTFNSSS